MYTFVSVWLVWIAFIVFIGGLIYRFVTLVSMAKKDKVIFPYMSLKYSLRSLVHWIIPFASRNMRMRYETTVVTFAFHLCAVLVPIFLTAHVAMIAFSWGVSWPMLSEAAADGLTIVVILAAVFFLLRRWMLPEVRFVTYPSDYLLLLVAAAPFITGFIAHRQWLDYDVIVMIHMICGAAMLILIPFTRLSHMLFFPFTRAYMGSEFGAVRNAKDW
jgi:nitrate reductase gamma subunit|uniref:Nitrate reductase n=1 Tax=Desulfomonile tiedjei TaxID=2358 RepID=A0A7C4ESG3_9BACT